MDDDQATPPARARQRLRDELRRARLDHDGVVASALGTALAAIDDAEAVPPSRQEAVEGAVPDVPRRVLDATEVAAAIDAEVTEAIAARAELARAAPGTDAVADLGTIVEVLTRHRDLARGSA